MYPKKNTLISFYTCIINLVTVQLSRTFNYVEKNFKKNLKKGIDKLYHPMVI